MIKLENVKKNFDSFHLSVSLSIEPGMISGIIGKNGAGKSTLFKSILQLLNIDSGDIYINNKSITDMTPLDREYIGSVLADSQFNGIFTIKDLSKIFKAAYSNFDEIKFNNLCKVQELPMDKKIKEFSTGMQAKVKVISAMSHGANILILDEPTAGLDVIARDEILDLLRIYIEENEEACILISSHISSDLESICDDIYMIDHGKILLHEETDVLLSEYALIKVNEEQFNKIDKSYIIKYKKENFGYKLLTKEKQFYVDNYPNIVIQNGSIDELIYMMIRGEDQ